MKQLLIFVMLFFWYADIIGVRWISLDKVETTFQVSNKLYLATETEIYEYSRIFPSYLKALGYYATKNK